jgi:hypothetical protein
VLDTTQKVVVLETVHDFERTHAKIGKQLHLLSQIEAKIKSLATQVARFVGAHKVELMPQKKSYRLPSGGAVGYREVPARISCSKEERDDLLDVVSELTQGACIKIEPRINETALREWLAAHPGDYEKIVERVSSFSLGRGYTQFWMEFPNEEKRVTGDVATGEYRPSLPDKYQQAA